MDDLSDKIDTLNKRMDRFFEWADLLQREFRTLQTNHSNTHVRLSFIEDQCLGMAEFASANEDVLRVRLAKIKK